jgi:hypothetical protein
MAQRVTDWTFQVHDGRGVAHAKVMLYMREIL